MTELKNHSAHQIGLGKCFNANTKPDKESSESTEETHACINVIKINHSNEPIEVDNKYPIISEVMKSISSRNHSYLDCILIANTKEISRGIFYMKVKKIT